ncbi:putative virion structural protein [Erwinia phage vB_EamM_Desertfox]|uniref:Putative virion structural protein n=2 Tax=Agricanvirus TaxID=1984776 RepID=A0A191ZCK0_9CAUD|nr:putative virion structural protein [Erwinia phage vB_EamM_Special G]YP_009622036.1 putative virion structural protein [Erwinia phage vB_EamM_Desertfox]ANJ65108.1 putative virion structural protein [Erwinia phage vB_EamM_Special G]AUG86402.1 putative virion structural protein [Erwinia phage vB_EamM_Desertfox]
MNIFNYVKGLIGTVDKRDVLSEIDALRDELTRFTINNYAKAMDVNVNTDGSNYYVKQISREFAKVKQVEGLRGQNLIAQTYISLKQLTLTLEWMRKQVEREYGGRIAREAVDFKQANFLRYIDSIDFYLRYARSMLLVVTSLNANPSADITKGFTVHEIRFLTDTAVHFIYLTSLFSQPVSVTEKVFDAVPSVVVSDADQQAIEAVLGNKTDVARSNFIPLGYNPFFLIGRLRAERRVKRLRAAEAAAIATELTLSKLMDKQAGGTEDPTIQKQIDHYQNQLNRLNFEIDQIKSEVE